MEANNVINEYVSKSNGKESDDNSKQTENAAIEEILQLLRKQSSILSNPENLIPIDYMEHIQNRIFERNRTLYKNSNMLDSEIIQYFREMLPRLKTCITTCDQLIEKLNLDRLLNIFKQYAKRKNNIRMYREFLDLEEELGQYMTEQKRKILIEEKFESE